MKMTPDLNHRYFDSLDRKDLYSDLMLHLEAEMHAMLSQALERCESLKMEAADAQRRAKKNIKKKNVIARHGEFICQQCKVQLLERSMLLIHLQCYAGENWGYIRDSNDIPHGIQDGHNTTPRNSQGARSITIIVGASLTRSLNSAVVQVIWI